MCIDSKILFSSMLPELSFEHDIWRHALCLCNCVMTQHSLQLLSVMHCALGCRFRLHLQGLDTQHGKSTSVAASQGTSRASSPDPDQERHAVPKAEHSQQSTGHTGSIEASAHNAVTQQHSSEVADSMGGLPGVPNSNTEAGLLQRSL